MLLTLEQELFTRFGYAAFKPGQKEVITNLLDGMNTLAVCQQGLVNHCVINLWARS